MVTKNQSHTPVHREGTPSIEGRPELVTATLDTFRDSKEARYRKLKQAYTALIKACIRILEEEGNGG